MNPLKALLDAAWRWWCAMPEPGPGLNAAQLAESDKRRLAAVRDLNDRMSRGTASEVRRDSLD